MKEILKLIKKYKWYAIITPILVMMELGLSVTIPKILSDLIDNGINKSDTDFIINRGLLIIGFSLIAVILGVISVYTGSKAAHGFGKEIRKKMYEKINNFSFSNIDNFSTSSLLTRLTSDVDRLSQGTMMTLRMLIRAPLMLFISAFFTIKINPDLTYIVLGSIPIIIIIAGILGKFINPIFMQIQQRVDGINKVVQENIKGIRVIKTYTLEKEESKKFDVKNKSLKEIFIKVVVLMNFTEPLFSFVISAAAVIVLFLGGKLVIAGNMLQGDLIAFITYSMQILVAFLMMAGYFMFIMSSIASFKRIKEVITTEPSIKEIDNPLTKFSNFNIEFKDVCFAYDAKKEEIDLHKKLKEEKLNKKLEKKNNRKNKKRNKKKDKEESNSLEIDKPKDKEINPQYILKNISFKLKEGESLGIIGPTGSGKSTIANLLLRFYDIKEGKILIGNKDIKEYALNTINENISLVQQKNTLFKGSIKDNLLMGKPDATDEELEKILKVSQAYEFVSEYTDYLDHKVLPNGQNFSGGQKQRLTIARALLKDFNILIIDDSTSALDYNTERKLQGSIDNINTIKNRDNDNKITKIFISQRINSVKNCDNILVLENGNIADYGKHDDLIKTSNFYKEIFIEQGGSYDI